MAVDLREALAPLDEIAEAREGLVRQKPRRRHLPPLAEGRAPTGGPPDLFDGKLLPEEVLPRPPNADDDEDAVAGFHLAADGPRILEPLPLDERKSAQD